MLVQPIGVSENMDVFIKRYMDVLAAAPIGCTSISCSRFTRIYLNAATSFSLDFQTINKLLLRS